jgi:hypothetical protein
MDFEVDMFGSISRFWVHFSGVITSQVDVFVVRYVTHVYRAVVWESTIQSWIRNQGSAPVPRIDIIDVRIQTVGFVMVLGFRADGIAPTARMDVPKWFANLCVLLSPVPHSTLNQPTCITGAREHIGHGCRP